MICFPCRDGSHEKCPGIKYDPTWCDCGHVILRGVLEVPGEKSR